MKPVDLVGKRFGMLTVLAAVQGYPVKNKQMMWWCRCDCGRLRAFKWPNLVSGKDSSCGCTQQKEKMTTKKVEKHNKSNTPEYKAWHALLQRKDVCGSWMVFENFLADVGPRPSADYCLTFVPTEQDKLKKAELLTVYRGPWNTKWELKRR